MMLEQEELVRFPQYDGICAQQAHFIDGCEDTSNNERCLVVYKDKFTTNICLYCMEITLVLKDF